MYTLRDLAAKAQTDATNAARGDDERIRVEDEPRSRPAVSSLAFPQVDPARVVSWLLDRWSWILAAMLIGALIGIGYGVTATPRYVVYTDILVPPSNLQVMPNDIYPQNQQSESQLLDVGSKLLVLTSGNVLRRVVKELDLESDPEFTGKDGGFSFRSLFGARPASGDNTLAAMRSLSERISAQRQERTFIITVAVWTSDPEKSVRVADAVAKAFEEEVAQSEAADAGRATSALSRRLAELKKEATEAEEKVAAFKRAHGLQASGGELISAQSMGQINIRLIDAQARLAEAQSRYQELTAASPNAISPSSTLQSPTLTGLRTQYATLKQRVDAMSMTYGPRYPGLVSAQSQLEGLQREIAQEIARMLRKAQVDVEQAASVVDTLNRQAARARASVSIDNDAEVQLSDLERDRAAKVAIYQTFLTRAGETAERQQLDTTNIRVISTAVPPLSRSWPPRTMLLAVGGAIVGSAIGICLVLALGLFGAIREEQRLALVRG
ncbi:lipopolysaccharide biosynthesis protein [Paramesorhizobium deserti]|uniref:Lipopolysaccharide biosynthesis protein n=1 Tax=Paramesorhizobium deserti TaxID=1494590 RepID=A0A135I2B4_9HYPH|nr:GumC family protein [Paramesorhizobium deserti]KXF79575.1 lipopolysaccharide biosynthesis protein [Paramesorhizobium deserti]